MRQPILRKVLDRVESLKPELASLTSDLIKFKTISPPSRTLECAEYIRSYLERSGINAEFYARKEGKVNVHVRVPGSINRTIIWLGHLDVVPAGVRDRWLFDPFSGVISDGKVYGRGASDMKGSCAAALIAARVLNEFSGDGRATVDFWFTCDEEVGSSDGTRWLIDTGLISGDACLIGDSLSRDPARDPYVDVGCKGYLRIRLKAVGRTAHASMPFYGDNAIDKLLKVIEAVKRSEEYPLSFPPDVERLIEPSIEYLLSSGDLSREQIEAIKRAYHRPTISLTMISGGVKVNVVPDNAEALFDIRITPGASPKDLAEYIRMRVDECGVKGVEVKVTGAEEGYYEDWGSRFAEALRETVKIVTGTQPKPKILLGATDAIHVKRGLKIPCLGFGAGIEELAHSPNEYVSIDGLLAAAKVYAALPLITGQYDAS